MSKFHQFDSREALDQALASHVALQLRADLNRRGLASLAVSGGSTPKGMFACLAQEKLDWNKVYITLVDERWVETDSDDSNERLVRENLLHGPAGSARFVSMKTQHEDANDALAELTARLESIPLPFSCVILGMGSDGHTASWFPQAINLAELLDPTSEERLGTCQPVTAPHQRITLTLPVVLAAGEIILHVTGQEKRTVLADATKKHYPISAITAQHDNPASLWWTP
ncbi:6-phosphogluconolactonase [Pseudohalioglobus lutimaris]|nr:6-phosphogluconolactonase [Pseudohalioglobus lutimaris]